MITAKVSGRYASVSFHEDLSIDQSCRYATIDFEWGSRDENDREKQLAKAFSLVMDTWLVEEARRVLGPHLCSARPVEKEIYLEDTWLMVNWENEVTKPNQLLLLDVLKRGEDLYDYLRKGAPEKPRPWWRNWLPW